MSKELSRKLFFFISHFINFLILGYFFDKIIFHFDPAFYIIKTPARAEVFISFLTKRFPARVNNLYIKIGLVLLLGITVAAQWRDITSLPNI
jgi:hypothetical protein